MEYNILIVLYKALCKIRLFSQGDHDGVQMLWDLIDFLMENGSSSVQNEILVVFTEEVDLDKYSSFISSELKDYFQI